MAKRIVPFFVLLVGLLCLSGAVAWAAAGEVFSIESVTYTDAAGKQQTVVFDMTTKTAPIPGVSVNNDSITNGVYGPNNAVVVASIRLFEGMNGKVKETPALNMGKWTAKVTKGKIGSNSNFTVSSEIPNFSDAATVNGKNIAVDPKTLSIGIP